MKILCMTCKEYILNTSDKFRVGAIELHGGMFEPATNDKWKATTFDCRPHTRRGDMWCPRCMGKFIGHKGEVLTEHGIIYPGQETLDTSFTILHPDGRMGHALPSRELPKVDRVALAAAERQKMIEDFGNMWAHQMQDLSEEESVTITPLAPKDVSDDHIKCPKCGKEYKNNEKGRMWYDKHTESCGK